MKKTGCLYSILNIYIFTVNTNNGLINFLISIVTLLLQIGFLALTFFIVFKYNKN